MIPCTPAAATHSSIMRTFHGGATSSSSNPERAPFFVAVPSYRRSDVIGEKTLAVLEKHQVPPEQVYIFVADAVEKQVYAQKLGDKWPNIIVGVPKLWRQRNFITQFFAEGSHVLSMDDDVDELYRLRGNPYDGGVLEPLHAGGLLDIIQDAWYKMHRLGLYLWSLNVSDNPYYMANEEFGAALTMKHGLCNGFFWGCRIRQDPDLELKHGDGHEDVERTVRYIHKDGSIFRYREFCAKTKCKIYAGGLQSSFRTKRDRDAEEERSINLLHQEFPTLLRLKPGSKLGAKFTSPHSYFNRHCMMPGRLFRSCVAQKKLPLLVGARCGFLRYGKASSTRPCGIGLCQIQICHQDSALICMKTGNGTCLTASVGAFNSALMTGRLSIIWLPQECCAAFDVPFRALDELPVFVEKELEPAAAQAVSANCSEDIDVQPMNEFARYLHSLGCDNCDSSSDEEEADEVKHTAVKTAGELRSKAKVESKKAERHESAAWIASQQADVLKSVSSEELEGCKIALDVLKDWAIESDFDTAIKHKLEEKASQTTEAASCKSTINELFCASRIWAGGWGAQCTHVRVPGDDYCSQHKREILRQGYLTHGRFDGEIPPKKRLEFEKWQTRLLKEQRSTSVSEGNVLSDAGKFSEGVWRSLGRGAGESARAYEFRTGIREPTSASSKKKDSSNKCEKVGPCESCEDLATLPTVSTPHNDASTSKKRKQTVPSASNETSSKLKPKEKSTVARKRRLEASHASQLEAAKNQSIKDFMVMKMALSNGA